MSTPQTVVFRRYLSAMVLNSLATAEAAGLNATDLYAINLLALAGPLASGELAVLTGLTTGATTRLIDRLEKGGHVQRSHDPADRRKVIVKTAGRPEGLDRVLTGTRQRIGEVLQSYSEQELATLFDFFDRAASAYQEATDELTGVRRS